MKSKEKVRLNILTVRLMKLLSLVLMAAPFMAVWFGWYADHVRLPMGRAALLLVPGLFLLLVIFFGRTYRAFIISYRSTRETFLSQVFTILMADGFMFLVLWIINVFVP